MPKNDLELLAVSIRGVAGDPVRREAFVTKGLNDVKALQRKSTQDYENAVSSLFICLESFDVVNGPDIDIMCELTVLNILLGLDLSSLQKTQCNSYVKLCLTAVHSVDVATIAAKIFSETLSYSLATEYLRSCVDDSLEWISLPDNRKNIGRKVCGILVLTEVSLRIPMLILQKLKIIFEKLWDPLASPIDDIRVRALRLFTLATKLLGNRPAEARTEIYAILSQQLKENLSSKAVNKKLAALLAFEPIVINSFGNSSSTSPDLKYEDLSAMLVPFITRGGVASSVPEVRELVLRCVVVLCRFNGKLFVSQHLGTTVDFILLSAKQNLQRDVSFVILTEIVTVIGKTDFDPFVDKCCVAIIEMIENSNVPCWEALKCFSTICKVCAPPKMEHYVDICMENIFGWGLSLYLIECMRDIITCSSPQYRSKLEQALLDMISVTLCGMPFRQRGEVQKLSDIPVFNDTTDREIAVALSALVQFGFSNSELMGDFLRDSVLPLIDSTSPEVRNAAIFAIVKLLIPPGDKGDISIARRLCINTVLFRLLVVALSDPNPTIRQKILSSFTPTFYPYLSEQQFLFRLFSALGDESIECKVAVLEQLCHMMSFDLSHTLPALREEMVSIINLINSKFSPQSVENGLRMLTAVASAAPQFVTRYGDGVVESLKSHFSTITLRSPILLSFLNCCTSVSKAINTFGKNKNVFKNEVSLISELLDTLPTESSFDERLSCLRFLSATLSPLVDGEFAYKVYPRLFRQLSNIIKQPKVETDIRLEALKCIGIIGALDPHTFQDTVTLEETKETNERVIMFGKITHEKCAGVVIWAIASLLDFSTVSSNTQRENILKTSLQSVLSIGERCECSWPKMSALIAPLAKVIVDLPPGRLLVTVLHEFCTIIYYVGDQISKDLNSIYLVFDTIWEKKPQYRSLVVRIFSFVSTAEGGLSSQQHMRILPQIFEALTGPNSTYELKYVILKYIIKHVANLQIFCETVVNNLLSATLDPESSQDFVYDVITTLKVVCSKLYTEESIGAIVRSLLTCLTNDRKMSKNTAKSAAIIGNIMGVFSILMVELQQDFLKYSVYINQTLKTCKITSNEFTTLSNDIASGAKCVRNGKSSQMLAKETSKLHQKCLEVISKYIAVRGDSWSYSNYNNLGAKKPPPADDKALTINESRILNCLKTVPLTREEWFKWQDQFSVIVLQESPYQVFRCTSMPMGINATPLVECAPTFTQNVLEVGFRSIWTYASATLRSATMDFFRQIFRQAMSSSTVPDEVLSTVLSVIEYMDHMGEVLSLEYNDLSDCAWSRGMLAKALYWREAAYRENPAVTVESLISLYSELHQVESSVGLMNMTSEEQHNSLLQSSLVKLARYTEALELTEKELESENEKDKEGCSSASSSIRSVGLKHYRSVPRMLHYNSYPNPENASSFSKKEETDHRLECHARLMLCLSELGNYNRVVEEWNTMYKKYSHQETEEEDGNILYYLSQYAADASIRLKSWDILENAIPWMPKDSVHYHIANASLNIANNKFDKALIHVRNGRIMLLGDLSSLLHESYARAYTAIVVAQELTELEEAAVAKRSLIELGSDKHVMLVSRLWEQRIRLMSSSVSVWKQILGIRGLLIQPNKDTKTRIRFVKLCRQENALQQEKFTLEQLIGTVNPSKSDLINRAGNLKVVMQYVTYLSSVNALGETSPFGTESELLKCIIDTHYNAGNQVLLSRAYAKLGMNVDLPESVECYRTATLYDPKWYIAWRLWAETNAQLLEAEYSDAACSNAIEGYIQSIQLGTSDSTLIQDVLKLLTLWNRHCDRETGLKELRKRVLNVSPRVWYLVVPQLIARLDLGSDESCQLVADIITNVALNYPHSLIYPLNLCTMSDSERRKRWADDILNVKLQDKFPILVLQGNLMINELIRSSALIYEQWHEKLETAANLFFGHHQRKDEMIRLLLPMHEALNKSPETLVESEFFSKYSSMLMEAREWVKSYSTTKNIGDLQSAWNLYHTVYKRIDDQIKSTNTLKMQFCSPKLFETRDLSIGIPDARISGEGSVSTIYSFVDVLNVIPSKQRPKRIGVITKEGKNQKYLLKGREDLRLDERVMQLFGLINILMSSDSRSCTNYGYQIQRYSVTPLKDTVGIIGWVDGCDTLHELVKYYRERKNIPTELEMRMLGRIITFDNVKAYDFLTMMSKVEVVEFLADHTSGQDIRKAMWSSAPNCELWMDRRQMYTTSLATMSVVGYILGLGDRHPNNIMIQRSTGLIVHIDFGDCFEVAMTRDKFPEKIPFRLTRMLRNALDVAGVDGTYRSNAETSMCVLREGSHSVLALLEAFIQDPLISWRLVNHPGQAPEISNDKTIEEQISIAKNRNVIQLQESITYSVDATQKGDASPALEMHLCCEEVDEVHQGVFIVNRLSSKLKGQDFISSHECEPLDPKTQVNRLISEAIDISNISQSWSGWYPFW